MKAEAVSFEGHEAVRLERDGVAVTVTTSLGPRVLGLSGRGDNLFAVLPDATLDRPDGGRFRLVGGHRLWAAPEVEDFTYQPDEARCAVVEVDGGVRVEPPPDGVGLVKAIAVRAAGDGWEVTHTIRNESGVPVTIAPWAITQMRMGGTAVLPLPPAGPGRQADRALVLWPYTELDDARLRPGRDRLEVEAVALGPQLKVGAAPGAGSVAYRVGGEVFEKHTAPRPDAEHVDLGAAVQVFVCDEFCELETLGPLSRVDPGDSVTHVERWTLRAADR